MACKWGCPGWEGALLGSGAGEPVTGSSTQGGDRRPDTHRHNYRENEILIYRQTEGETHPDPVPTNQCMSNTYTNTERTDDDIILKGTSSVLFLQ